VRGDREQGESANAFVCIPGNVRAPNFASVLGLAPLLRSLVDTAQRYTSYMLCGIRGHHIDKTCVKAATILEVSPRAERQRGSARESDSSSLTHDKSASPHSGFAR